MTEEIKAPEKVLYDQTAGQKVSLQVPAEGELFDVRLGFAPLADEAVFEYLEVKEDDAAPSTLFKALLLEHNIQGEDGQYLPVTEVAEVLDVDLQEAVVEKALLGVRFLTLPKAEGKFLKLTRGERYSVWPLAATFNGEEIATKHKLRRPNQADRQRFQSLFTKPKFIGRELCHLYDCLKHSVEGYAGNQVPPHHKIAVIVKHFGAYEEVLVGKSIPAPPQ